MRRPQEDQPVGNSPEPQFASQPRFSEREQLLTYRALQLPEQMRRQHPGRYQRKVLIEQCADVGKPAHRARPKAAQPTADPFTAPGINPARRPRYLHASRPLSPRHLRHQHTPTPIRAQAQGVSEVPPGCGLR
jgi:hypothetical protein